MIHVVPLLFEGDFWRTCDRTVLVAPPDVRIARVIARDAAEREAVERRIGGADRSRAGPYPRRLRIENGGDRAALREETSRVHAALLRDLAAKEDPR